MLPNKVRIGQNSDHREIACFLFLQDRNFRSLLKRLEIFKNEVVQKMQSFTCAIPPRETAFWVLEFLCPFFEGKKPTAPVQTYDYPSLPCNTLYGRKDVLEQMDCYFAHNPAQRSG